MGMGLLASVVAHARAALLAAAVAAAAAALFTSYRQVRYWRMKQDYWRAHFRASSERLRVLIAEAQHVQDVAVRDRDPSADHSAFAARYDDFVAMEFGARRCARLMTAVAIDRSPPATLVSDDQIFAWYDAEWRISALRMLLAEVESNVAALEPPGDGDTR
jgi:hypothetical protein